MGASSGQPGQARLSRREMEVARLVAEGMTNREIATRLFVSERTVDGHLEHVREKLGVRTRAQVATWVVGQGSVSIPTADSVQPVSRTVARTAATSRRWLWAMAAALVLVEAVVILLVVEQRGPNIFTVAGASPASPGVGEYSGNDVPPTNAEMSLPSDVAALKDGSLYIADYKDELIRRVAGGRIVTVAGGGDRGLKNGEIGTSAQIGHASNLAIDLNGRLNFLTNSNGMLEVWRIETDLSLNMVVSVGPSNMQFGQFWPPPVGGLAIGPHGTIYISDRSNNLVYSYTAGDLRPSVFAGMPGEAGFSGETGPATGLRLWRPGGLAVDAQGNVYIADSGNNRIRKVNTKGEMATVAGSGKYYGNSGDGGPATKARLAFPFGVAVAGDGTIYIADTGNNRLREVISGVMVALAGTGLAGFEGDGGPARGAELAAPEGIALDGKGDLFIADTVNLRVREIVGVPA